MSNMFRCYVTKYVNYAKYFDYCFFFNLEPPQPKGVCPRLNGFFANEDPGVCNKFYNCIQGEHTEITCTAGLHFDEFSGTCVWPDSAGRQGCNAQTSKCSRKYQHILPRVDLQEI